jgi:hypothetical protein
MYVAKALCIMCHIIILVESYILYHIIIIVYHLIVELLPFAMTTSRMTGCTGAENKSFKLLTLTTQ